jgi:hypothetical protein
MQSEKSKITEKYGTLKKELSQTNDQERQKIMKALDDIRKYKGVYKTIVD